MSDASDSATSSDKQPPLTLPRVVFGSSALGNLFEAVSEEKKREIVAAWIATGDSSGGSPIAIDTAGKYGAGLALEQIGKQLRALAVAPERVVISNKLGWYRVPLTTPEPTFEPGAWVGIEYDAELRISRQGILDCWEQGCGLLGEPYKPQMVSVHDPDEFLASAMDADDKSAKWDDLRGAYESLSNLKAKGEVEAIGVGAKDWRVSKAITDEIDLDWVMVANSLTVYSHPTELLDWLDDLHRRGVVVINSAVFHSGFLVGGEFFDYRRVSREEESDRKLFAWRDAFNDLCDRHGVKPAAVCAVFGLSPPGVQSLALSTTNPKRIAEFTGLVQAEIPNAFWSEAKSSGLVDAGYPYL